MGTRTALTVACLPRAPFADQQGDLKRWKIVLEQCRLYWAARSRTEPGNVG